MKKQIFLLVILASFLMIQVVSADEVYSHTSRFDLVAGCSLDYKVIIEREGSPIECTCEIIITPNGEGIEVSFPEPLNLDDGLNTIDVTVNTSMMLAPGEYVIKFNFYKEEQPSPPKKKPKSSGSNTPGIKTEETFDAPYDPDPLYPPEEPGEPQYVKYVSEARDSFPWYLIPIPFIIVFITLLLLYGRKKKGEN